MTQKFKKRNRKNLLLKVLCLLFFSVSVLFKTEILMAQTTNTVNGIVLDEAAMPLIGANVLIKGTKTGTITDVDGSFSIPVRENATLVISFLGYKTEEIMVQDKKELKITLVESANIMDEVVVVGYGSVRRGDLTGAVGSVDVESMAKAPVASFDNALAGRVAGVQVSSSDGQPGSQSNVVIRGAGSLTQNVAPIYVVDGFVFEDFDPSSINPQDITSINVLKDASSTAIYGSRGANGVIIITTKMGNIGKPSITYNASLGFNKVTKRMDLMDSYEFVKFQIERFPGQARSAYFPDIPSSDPMNPEIYRNVSTIDWQDQILRTGYTQIHNLSISGGSATTKYLASVSYFGEEGTIINTDYNKITGRMVLEQAISSKLNMKLSALYSRDHTSGIIPSTAYASQTATSTLFFSTYGYRPLAGLNPEDNEALLNNILDLDPNIKLDDDYRINPRLMAENTQRNSINTKFIPDITFTYNISKHLSLLVKGGLYTRIRENNFFYNSKTTEGITRPGIVNKGVQGGADFYQYSHLTNENILTYTNTVAKIHKLEAQIGFSIQGINTSNHGVRYQLIPFEELGLSGMDRGVPAPASSWLAESKDQSVFGRINYNILSRYLFTVTYRADGSSKFPVKNRWGYFPSGAFAWRISDEPFLKKLKYLNDSKLRFSYGLTGNNRVGNYDFYASLTTPYSEYYSFQNQTPGMGASRNALGNPDLRWETTAQTNIGYDLSLFKNRFKLTLDLYRKTTKDLLLLANLPAISGFPSAYKNIGSIQNDGLEISLSTVNVRNKNFSWSTEFNIGFNGSKVLELNGEEPYMYNYVTWENYFNGTPLYRTKVGGPVAEFWGVKWNGVYQYSDFDLINNQYVLKADVTTNGKPREQIQPGDIKYKDLNDDLVVDSNDRTVIGNPLPKHIGGLNNTVRYKNFSLNIFLQWSYGNDVFNANRLFFEGGVNVRPLQNQFASYANRWTPDNQTSTMFRAGGAGPNGVYSSMHVEDGSYLRLKTIALTYRISSELINKINIKGLSLGVSAQNLYTWHAYSGLDPEVSVRDAVMTPGFDFSSYPRSMSMVFDLKLTL